MGDGSHHHKPSVKRPCRTCPFRRTAVPGYLGDYRDAEHFLEVHYRGDTVNPCHETVDYSDPDWLTKFKAGDEGRACAGQGTFYRNDFKEPRRWDIPLKIGRDVVTVFETVREFLAHHMPKAKTGGDDGTP